METHDGIEIRALLSLISPDCFVEDGVDIGVFTIIRPGCSVGYGTTIGDYVRLESQTEIGKECRIDHYVRSSGNCSIGHASTLRYGVTVARSVTIGRRCFLAPGVLTLYNKGQETIIEDDVFIGAGSVIAGGVRIVAGCVIGAKSFVKNDCLLRGLYVGTPAAFKREVK